MANNNCLAGFKCPQCESEGPYDIDVRTTVRMFDDGSEDVPGGGAHLQWDNDSEVRCVMCGEVGTVASFTGQPAGEAD